MHDVIIIGGGVIGLTISLELARRGLQVAVLDQAQLGQESSWAGAGMLVPGNPEKASSPQAQLRAASHVLWPGLSQWLREETGIDNGYRRCGGIEIRLRGDAAAHDETAELEAEIGVWRVEGVEVEPLSAAALAAYEPAITADVTAAYRLPALGQVRNPRHLKALIAACAAGGVSLLPGTPAHGFEQRGEKMTAVRTSSGSIPGGQFVVASGAWSSRLLAESGRRLEVGPVRGQMVLLSAQPAPITHVINSGPRYLVPRSDGRILVGSTEEQAGFDKRNTAAGVGELIEFAIGIVPSLRRATLERTWAGLRPYSPDGLPTLGLVPETTNLFVATGHFRAGLQLSPVTARVMSQLLMGVATEIPLAPFAVFRKQEGGKLVDAKLVDDQHVGHNHQFFSGNQIFSGNEDRTS